MTAVFLFLSWIVAPSLAAEAPDWEKLSDEDGIQVFRKEIPNSSLVAFRGEATVDQNLAKVVQLLSDSDLRKQWVANIKEAHNVRVVSPLERIEYNHTGAPWPIKDRDFVFSVRVEMLDAEKSIKIWVKSVEDPLAPETSNVRGTINYGHYVLRSLEGGKKTWMQVEIHVDPKGAIPKWVVNLFQKKWPRKTLEGIRRMAAKSEIPDHPMARDWLNRIEKPKT